MNAPLLKRTEDGQGRGVGTRRSTRPSSGRTRPPGGRCAALLSQLPPRVRGLTVSPTSGRRSESRGASWSRSSIPHPLSRKILDKSLPDVEQVSTPFSWSRIWPNSWWQCPCSSSLALDAVKAHLALASAALLGTRFSCACTTLGGETPLAHKYRAQVTV